MAMVLSDKYLGHYSATDAALKEGRTATGATFFPLRNRIINGDFRINQIAPGVTGTNFTTRFFTIDRWYTIGSVASTFTTQIVSDGPTSTTVYYGGRRNINLYPSSTFDKCVELKCTAARTLGSTDVYAFGQNIEGRHIADMQFGESINLNYMMLSFWTKASRTGTYTVRLQNSAQNRTFHQVYTVATANTWEYQEILIPVDQTGTWLNDINTGLRLIFNLGIGTTYRGTTGLAAWAATSTVLATNATSIQLVDTLNSTLRLTGIQLEFIGTGQFQSNFYASPFEVRPFQQELDLCMRYFQKSWAYGTAPGTQSIVGMLLHTDLQYTTVQQYLNWKWPTPMRAAPTVQNFGYNSPGNAGYGAIWNQNISFIGDSAAATSGVTRHGAMFYLTGNPTHTMAGYHFKADAEPT